MSDPTIAPRVKDLIVRRLKLEIDPATIQDDAPALRRGPGPRFDRRARAGARPGAGVRHQGGGRRGGRQGLRVRQRPGRLHRAEEDRVTAAGALPHGYPFRFADAVVEERNADFSRGRVRVGVTANGRAAMGEQWGSPLLLAEAIAQAALLLQGGDPEIGPPRLSGGPGGVPGAARAPGGRDAPGGRSPGGPLREGRAFRRGSAFRWRIDCAREYPRAQRR